MTIVTEKKTPEDSSRESEAIGDKSQQQDKTTTWSNLRLPLGAILVCSMLATLVFTLIRMALDIHISRMYLPLLAFPLNILVVYKLFPQIIKIPFGEVSPTEFFRKIGLSKPCGLIKNIFLGITVGACSLTGMLVGSLLTGRYSFDIAAITLEQIAFSTVPGVWEEVFYRGILMFVLLGAFRDVRKTAVLQSVIFGLFHFRGLEFWTLVDIGSVTLIGLSYTYTAYKTNSLIPIIIAHYLHDALLLLVRVPGGEYIGAFENIVFYVSLWLMLGVGCLISKLGAEKFGITQRAVLYDIGKLPQQ